MESALWTRALITGVFTALLDGVRVVPDHICDESPRLSALRRQIGHYDDASVRREARTSKMGDINGGSTCVGWHGEVTSMGTDVLYTACSKV